ncbi:hypothetical protein [Thermosipho atlanticus]|nr:hypothetical protein [Thermosipho atlanticus]
MEFKKYVEKLNQIRDETIKTLLDKWNPKNELYLKVDKNGKYKDFKGDTIVFFLNDADKRKITKIQNELYSKIGKYLAKPLSEKYFHLTLHDLCNFNITNDVEKCMKNNENKVMKILNTFKNEKNLKMKSIGLYNGGSAIGIMFKPIDEESFLILIKARQKFDQLIKQDDFYIPHVTLGYYLPIDYSESLRKKIFNTLIDIDINFEIELDFHNLKYTHFTNMDNYIIK